MEAELEQKLKRLMLFRVVMITTLLLIAAYVEMVSETLLSVNPLYFLIAATYALTLAYVAMLGTGRYRETQVHVQVIGDIAIVTGLVYLTGGSGTRAGFLLLYPISVLSASVLLPFRKALALAGLAILLYAGVLLCVRQAWIPARGLADVPFIPLKQVLYSIFVTGVACATVAMTGSYLSENLRSVGRRLEESVEEIADLRHLNAVIIDSMQSGLLTADASGRVLHVNPFGENVLGRRVAELRGQLVRDVLDSPALDAPALRAGLDAGLRPFRVECPYRRREDVLDLGFSVSPLAGTDPGGYLLVFQDLTHIKHLERQIRVKEKLAAVGEMAAYLAHEIRNPLGSISGSAQVLMEEDSLSGEQGRLLQIIHRESQRLSNSLNQFLFQIRPEQTPLSLVDLAPLISGAVALLQNAPEVRPDHNIVFEAPQGTYICFVRPDHIVQVFWNLVRNGLEAMSEGGTLAIDLSRDRGDALLVIQDEGRGITNAERPRVFEPFRTLTASGTGLGLAIVYQIVKQHGGDIVIANRPPRGTVVQVRLPLAASA